MLFVIKLQKKVVSFLMKHTIDLSTSVPSELKFQLPLVNGMLSSNRVPFSISEIRNITNLMLLECLYVNWLRAINWY